MLNIRLPSEIKRGTRSINDRHFYKANEYKNIALYLSFALFKNQLNNKYFSNLVKYILFLRILCQDSITKNNIRDSDTLIKEFIIEYQELYGKEFMSSNLHAHIHLPKQVEKFGPLNKCSCFPFENMFKISRSLFHGTSNYEGQIARNFELRKNNRINLTNLKKNTSFAEIRIFINEHFTKKRIDYSNRLINSQKKMVKQLKLNEIELLVSHNFKIDDKLEFSMKAFINKQGKIFFYSKLCLIMFKSLFMFNYLFNK